jgi:hypothetical protein
MSLLGHVFLLLGLLWLGTYTVALGPTFIAAGPGDGPGGQAGPGNAIEVGLIGASEFLRFSPEPETATLGNEPNESAGFEDVQQNIEEAEMTRAEPVPGRRRETEANVKTTERPVSASPERPYAPDKPGTVSSSTSALIGMPGSPLPGRMTGGIGLGDIGGGIPGGSDYGRRLQQALIGYYRLIPRQTTEPRYVIVRVRIARNGQILSVQDGQLDPTAFVHRSGNVVIDSRVAAALLEVNRNPIPFPANFLPGYREALAEIYFQYK